MAKQGAPNGRDEAVDKGGTGEPVRLDRRDGFAIVIVDNPPVNALSQAVRNGLLDAAIAIAEDASIEGFVIACAGRTFVVGADIREFGSTTLEPFLPDVIAAFEATAKPSVAAIHGTALGGGFELALGCTWRMMAQHAEVGLPEVGLGLIPGAGGTQRLPRLAGIAKALDLVVSGRRVGAREAVDLGIADAISEGDLVEDALAFLATQVVEKAAATPVSKRPVPAFDEKDVTAIADKAKQRARGQISPTRAVEAVLNAAYLPFAEGMAAERASFLALVPSDQAKALRHAFFGKREVWKVPGLDDVASRPVERIGIVGAGTMGAGIAVAAADAGYAVTVVETSEAAATSGWERIEGIYDGLVQKGRLDAARREARLANLTVAAGIEALKDCDLVVEAVFEDMAVKKDLVRQLGAVLKPDAILASNTSYLDLDAIAAAAPHPENVCGMHFFSPANVMKLLEVVRGKETAPEVIQTALAVGRRMGKIAVVAGVCDGFIGNRIWAAWRCQAEFLLEDGAAPEEIDAAMVEFGFPMGPFAVYDLSGLDIAWAQRKRQAATRDPYARYVAIPDRVCEAGRLGRKTGAGWYSYASGKAQPDPAVGEIIEGARRQKGIVARAYGADEIQARARAAMVNEGARILEEGIALRPVDVDMVMIHGYGYPAWRGGPMFEADLMGLNAALSEVRDMCRAAGYGFQPSRLLVRLAEDGRSFADWAAERAGEPVEADPDDGQPTDDQTE